MGNASIFKDSFQFYSILLDYARMFSFFLRINIKVLLWTDLGSYYLLVLQTAIQSAMLYLLERAFQLVCSYHSYKVLLILKCYSLISLDSMRIVLPVLESTLSFYNNCPLLGAGQLLTCAGCLANSRAWLVCFANRYAERSAFSFALQSSTGFFVILGVISYGRQVTSNLLLRAASTSAWRPHPQHLMPPIGGAKGGAWGGRHLWCRLPPRVTQRE